MKKIVDSSPETPKVETVPNDEPPKPEMKVEPGGGSKPSDKTILIVVVIVIIIIIGIMIYLNIQKHKNGSTGNSTENA